MLNKINHFLTLLGETMKSVLRIWFFSKFRSHIPSDNKVGEVIVIGNAPSLNQNFEESLPFIVKNKTICVNSFVLSPYYEKIKPSYCVFADPGFFLPKAISQTIELREKVIQGLIEKTDWPIILFVPIETALFSSAIQGNKNLKIVVYNKTKVLGFKHMRFWAYSHKLGMPPCENVLIAGLLLAILMNFKTIYLIGAEHSWHRTIFVDKNNNLGFSSAHFYDIDSKETAATPVIDPMTRQKSKIHGFFQAMSKAFYSYILVEEYAVHKKVQIYNSSKVSYIDAFARKELPLE